MKLRLNQLYHNVWRCFVFFSFVKVSESYLFQANVECLKLKDYFYVIYVYINITSLPINFYCMTS